MSIFGIIIIIILLFLLLLSLPRDVVITMIGFFGICLASINLIRFIFFLKKFIIELRSTI